jgi:hypothetical protein
MSAVAFKEWAAVCRALGSGRQSLILRKGGIAEIGGVFRPEHETFLLYPTSFHEPRSNGLKAESTPDGERAGDERPATGTVLFRHVAAVTAVYVLRDLDAALRLDPYHVWTADAIATRFHYRSPGLYAMVVRMSILPQAVIVPEDPSYAGCKSWVPLVSPVPTDRAIPVLDDATFGRTADAIRAAVA